MERKQLLRIINHENKHTAIQRPLLQKASMPMDVIWFAINDFCGKPLRIGEFIQTRFNYPVVFVNPIVQRFIIENWEMTRTIRIQVNFCCVVLF